MPRQPLRGSHLITNDGTISSTDSTAVLADGAGILLNTGKITGGVVGISYVDTNANDVLTTVNTGMISGTPNPANELSIATLKRFMPS